MNLRHVPGVIREKMRAQAPALFVGLRLAGTLDATIEELTDEIGRAVVDASFQAGRRPGLQASGRYLERVRAMEAAARAELEARLAELEFADDERP